ncbi:MULTISPECIES: arylsulfatase [Ramlibacter]|uniref:Sulfatase-like hydrolase/transferase n=1 Tax=Ramlibacter pinisoli TaxID=2682844 RepID=A0A6N8IST6_9BURK|nr:MULTISPECIES: arylsulfatase [Ramlibacter]MBA2964949.1 arylsulfatase [Ramlibacter sp. CGMCC 1.13660]MVQ29914.1 sulfatase-like hydrolase/transferase [Ramlibacter pinisoli]
MARWKNRARNAIVRAASTAFTATCIGLAALCAPAALAQNTQGKKPNIVVIFGDDVGLWNISAYHRGMMGGSTPNIDRLARDGAIFTDYYSQNSCTAGRAAFITGQSPLRTGLLKVGLPGARQGLQDKDPTIADLLKPMGYATAQIGKNHLGDRNEYLPTLHGFDEFYGNLYHLNSEEEPEDPDYPKNPEFHARFGPRGVLDCRATPTAQPGDDPRFGAPGKQACKDTGPLTRKRMETVEDDLLARSVDFMDRSVKAGKPFFLWHNSTRMHVWTRLSPKWENKSGYGLYADGMQELDHVVGQLLDKLDQLGIADNTIVVFSSDNGAEIFTWPDGGMMPFKGEKGTTWEGGFRAPAVVRWPGVVKPASVVKAVMSHEDWLPTFMAAAGDADVKKKLLGGMRAGDRTYKTHLDGYDFMPFFKGEAKAPRREFFFFDDNANLNAIRYDDWKITFSWIEGHLFSGSRKSANVPLVVNLRQDPFERTPFESDSYRRFQADKLWTLVPAQAIAGQFIQSFKDYPPSQRTGSMNLDQVMESLQSGAGK